MKRLIFACLAAAGLVSLSACTTSNGGQRDPIFHPDPASGPDTSSVPIVFDPDIGVIQ
jgi:predicted small lipoprotein YifL